LSICCRSKAWDGVVTCCPQGSLCNANGECANFMTQRGWIHIPVMVGVLMASLFVCGVTCICYSRMQQRRRRVLAAQLAMRLALMNDGGVGSDSEASGVPQNVIDSLPTLVYTKGCIPAEKTMCSICLNDYEVKDELRTLPCTHFFHSACIDRWLSNHTTCPLCVRSVEATDNETQEAS